MILSVGGRNIESEILITPDLNGLIVGIDWLAKQGEFVWDFRNQKIKFADGKWMNLHEEDQDETKIRKIYVEEDVILPPSQQTDVPVRISHHSRRDRPFVGMIENGEVPAMTKVYNARSVIPAKFTNVKIPVLNIDKRTQTLKKGTKLGVLQEAEIVEPNPDTKDEKKMSSLQAEVIEKMTNNLPKELTEEQRRKAKELLRENHAIFSTSERTNAFG